MNELALTRKKPPWILVAVPLVVVAAAAWFFWPAAPAAPRLVTASVDRGDVVQRVTATGTLSALVTVEVGAQVSARIMEILVDFNSEVKKGEVIARLDRQLFEAAVTEARANQRAALAAVERARVQAAQAARNRDRGVELAAKKLIAPSELENLELALEVAKADVVSAQGQVEQAGAALHRASVNLGFTTIVSPIDGVVISRDVDVGQTVAASLQAPTLFTIAQDLKKMQVDTSVSEADIGKIAAGMEATFSVDAWPGERFRGTVRQIRNAPQTTQSVVTYTVIIDVDNAALRLRPGMTANVTFVVDEARDVLRVPNAALRFRPPASFRSNGAANGAAHDAANVETGRAPDRALSPAGQKPNGGREVWVVRGGAPVSVRLRTGLSDGSTTVVLEGDLRPGDEVVTEASEATNGAARPSSNPFAPRVPRPGR